MLTLEQPASVFPAAMPEVSAVATPTLEHADQLSSVVGSASSCLLRPLAFFVSWQGVLTLAYTAFPPELLHAKAALNSIASLPTEYSGSKWPKTTLGCLGDAKRLTPEQLALLNTICKEESLGMTSLAHPFFPRSQAVLVDKLAVVFYQCRSLEKRLLQHVLPLGATLDASEAPEEEQARVKAIVAEADAPEYWYQASRDGSREAHYRGAALGVTLVHDLECCRPADSEEAAAAGHGYGSALPGMIKAFRERVELELPGMYCWFDDSSLHITVRALMG